MIYVLTEWDGKGSGEKSFYKEKGSAMKKRKCTLTYEAALKEYGTSYFRNTDVKCSTIDSFISEKQLRQGNVNFSKTWY
jgi:hypothetical protein